MLPPNTALTGQSIWDRVGRETFEGHVDALHRTKYVPDSHVILEKDWPKPDDQDILPFAVERQLVDDFAFIAAREYGVGYVTAAAVEPARRKPWGLTVRLAANDGICNPVKDTIEELFSILERCARKGKVDMLYPSCFLYPICTYQCHIPRTLPRTVCRGRI